jgi:serine/threonine-protein kinase
MAEHDEYTGPFKVGDEILGEYVVTGMLGSGGHAFVYECRDLYMDITFAIKVIPGVPGRGKDLLKRAKAEAKLLLELNHPNVVRVVNARPAGDSMVCIVMERLRGLSLRDMLVHLKRFTVTEALLIVRQIAEGVGAAHDLEVIHRDLKPENVFILPPNNLVKVLDFGIAKFTGHGLETTNKARIHGTPYYMSPEHLQNIAVTVRSDIYELGTLAFELITGKIPCLVDLENPDYHQMAYVQIMKVTPPLTRLIRDVGPRTEYFVQRSTAKEPAQRFANMKEVVAAIDEALAEQKLLYPREAETIRYISEEMVQAAKAAAAKAAAEEDEEDSWEPPPRPRTTTPPPSAATEPTPFVRGIAPVMAPTVELSGAQPNSLHPDARAVPAASTSLGGPLTDASFAGSISTLKASKRFSPWFFVAPAVIGLGLAVAITWPDIQRARAGRVTTPPALEVSVVTLPQPPPPLASVAASAQSAPAPIAAEAASPGPSTVPAVLAVKPAKKSPARATLSDNVPEVTKAELARLKARERAFAEDLDRETAASKKAITVKP